MDFSHGLHNPKTSPFSARRLAWNWKSRCRRGTSAHFGGILCKDALDGSWVLIENQLEHTDYTHLGQLLTYAAGLHAATIVWVAGRFTDEHRAALDWLNEVTGEKFRFFGVEVELWRIGSSPAAP